MTQIRPQYHFRHTQDGLLAYDVRRLVRLAQHLPVMMIDPKRLAELDENHWYGHEDHVPTPRSIIDHVHLIQASDIDFPIILDQSGRLMDGMHRVCKAILEEVREIPAVQFAEDPEPDFVDCAPADLPYE